MQTVKTHASFGGRQGYYRHDSDALGCAMEFAVYVPESATKQAAPVVYFLSGLTCTAENVTTKSGMQAVASQLGLIVVAPDTSPRGDDVPDDE